MKVQLMIVENFQDKIHLVSYNYEKTKRGSGVATNNFLYEVVRFVHCRKFHNYAKLSLSVHCTTTRLLRKCSQGFVEFRSSRPDVFYKKRDSGTSVFL